MIVFGPRNATPEPVESGSVGQSPVGATKRQRPSRAGWLLRFVPDRTRGYEGEHSCFDKKQQRDERNARAADNQHPPARYQVRGRWDVRALPPASARGGRGAVLAFFRACEKVTIRLRSSS
jgi:hypothetical protein